MYKVKRKRKEKYGLTTSLHNLIERYLNLKYKHYLTFIIKTKSEKLRESALKQIRNTQH